jgi:hypothetical protein
MQDCQIGSSVYIQPGQGGRYNVDNFSRDCASKTIDSISTLLPLEAWVALSAAQRPLLTACINCIVASSEVRTSTITNVVSTLFFCCH